MATKQTNNLLSEELKLKRQLKQAEDDIAAAKKAGAKEDGERLKKLDKFKLQNA